MGFGDPPPKRRPPDVVAEVTRFELSHFLTCSAGSAKEDGVRFAKHSAHDLFDQFLAKDAIMSFTEASAISAVILKRYEP